MADPVALAALALDASLGWPARLYATAGHPVGFFARIIAFCEGRWNRQDWSGGARKAAGVGTVAVLVGVTFAATATLSLLAEKLGSVSWLVLTVLAWPALAQRSLDQHVTVVIARLQEHNLCDARKAVGMIVGRDTALLDEAGVSRAAIESLAESFCDGVIAPLLWLLVGGLPGAWVVKAVNTADSLIGHKEEPYGDFGWAAAKLDDAMNFLPARLSSLLICVAGAGGWRIVWRYHHAHASPNAGWPEAAMAGVLGVRLAGPASYDGVRLGRPWIGEGGEAGLEALVRARAVYRRACALVWIVAGGSAWLV